ncbi:hypothetical protein XBP1_1850021 [Xenorhabdus bovienii str. puntauvense]|uniref:Uncharacterized protein n=3 Tax=Xenorhabdus bovienii TaxID=40576 RepID=A0A0B6XDU8_XENBV|nr:hypothetical protein XBP1_1850021 [Xenorhabdus bovienii str. puntauvense]CDH00910.1 hypothetical protein XBFM1_1910066 [Xenorhabdus bovienii str. feltiae Moldova]CDM92037.1 protein of unknown function [Xenorhabdus bovienii]
MFIKLYSKDNKISLLSLHIELVNLNKKFTPLSFWERGEQHIRILHTFFRPMWYYSRSLCQ